MQKIYVAVKHVPRETPGVGLTIAEIASCIGVHRNSIRFNNEGVAVVKGWLVYALYVERTRSALGRPGNLPQNKERG